MSLELFNSRTFTDFNRSDYIKDVEREFCKVQLPDTVQVRNIMKEIEGAEYVSSREFRDRFGDRLYIDRLSTGCKAALVVATHPEYLVDLRECGLNARDAILYNCREGKVIFYDMDTTIKTFGRSTCDIDVIYGGKRYLDVDSLNEVI